MLRSFFRDAERVAIHDDVETFDAGAQYIWFDLLSPIPTETKYVEDKFSIAIPTRDEMEDIELSARLYQEDGAQFMTMTMLAGLEGDEPIRTPVTFILKENCLITVRYADTLPFRQSTSRLLKGPAAISLAGEMAMLGILEAVIDRTADVLERIGREIDTISREVFRSKTSNATKKTRNLQSVIEQIGQKGDFLTAVSEGLVSISRLVAYHAAVEQPGRKMSKETRQVIKLLQRDGASLGDHAAFLSSKINFLLDATLGLINLEQNQIIKIFSVAAVVFLPPTLVASMYGMNFEVMPELRWEYGYPFAIAMMIVSAAMPFLYFKRRGWL